ncbi:MAG: hypothetical protein ABW169_09920 [Sphingobium sp.]
MEREINLSRFSKGKRSLFFNNEETEHLLAMTLEIATELAVAYNRISRLEHVLIESGVVSQNLLDAYEPTPDAQQEQDEWANLLLDRMYASLQQSVQGKADR